MINISVHLTTSFVHAIPDSSYFYNVEELSLFDITSVTRSLFSITVTYAMEIVIIPGYFFNVFEMKLQTSKYTF